MSLKFYMFFLLVSSMRYNDIMRNVPKSPQKSLKWKLVTIVPKNHVDDLGRIERAVKIQLGFFDALADD